MKTTLCVSFGCYAMVGVACSDAQGESAVPEQSSVTIGWLAQGAQDDFFDLSRSGANLAAEELSDEGTEVEVILLDADERTPEAQRARVEAAIDLGVDALDVSVSNPEVLTPAINDAVDAGIPVITFDSDAPASKRSTFYGISNWEAAVHAARLLGGMMDAQGKVAIMSEAGPAPGTLSPSLVYVERMDGFRTTLAEEFPNIEVVSIATCSRSDERDKAGCTGILEEVTAHHPDVAGWYLAKSRALRESDLASLAPNWSAKALSGRIAVVGFDAPRDALHAVEQGLCDALITQDYFGWGYDVVHLSHEVLTAGRELDAFTDSEFEVVCASNVHQLIDMWEMPDFRSPLDECDFLK